MDQNTNSSQQQSPDREKRHLSHALVEIKRYKHLPIFCHSGVLLDLSAKGFKLEFVDEVEANMGNKYWLSIPLSPLGISSPRKLLCQCECRWFDDSRFRIGGIFLNLTEIDRMIIQQIITTLQERSSHT